MPTISIKELGEQRQELGDRLLELIDNSGDPKRAWTPENEAEYVKKTAEFEELTKVIERRKAEETIKTRLAEKFHTNIGHIPAESAKPLMGRGDEDRASVAPKASGMAFRDGQGRELRAFTPAERLTPEGRELPIGRLIAAAVTGRMHELDPGEARALLGGIDSSGGFLLSPAASTRFIDLARSASVAVAAGAQTVPIDGETNLVRLSSDPTPGWRAEWVNIPVGDMGFEKITLQPKTLAVVIPVSIELSEDSTNLGSIIESAIREQMGLLIDKAVLFGQGSESVPQGIRFTTGIGTITSFGTPADFVKFVQAVEKVLTANYSGPIEGLALILHPRDMSKIQQLKETGNQPLIPPEWFARLRKFSTTSLSITEGGGGAESSGYLGDFSQVLLGVRTQIAVRVLDQGAVTDSSSVTWNAAAQLGKLVVAHTRLDVAVLRPAFFVHMSGITIT